MWRGHVDVASWLASLPGVDVRATNRWGCNAVLWACIQHDPRGGGGGGDGRLIRAKTKKTEGEADTETAAHSPLHTVKWLIETLRVRADVVNVNRHSAIHKCAIYGHGDVIAYLLSETSCREAKHMGRDDRGSTPSDLAAQNGFDELAAQLREIEDETMRLPVVFDGGGRGGEA